MWNIFIKNMQWTAVVWITCRIVWCFYSHADGTHLHQHGPMVDWRCVPASAVFQRTSVLACHTSLFFNTWNISVPSLLDADVITHQSFHCWIISICVKTDLPSYWITVSMWLKAVSTKNNVINLEKQDPDSIWGKLACKPCYMPSHILLIL